MAHFAQLDKNNRVLQVIVIANSEIIDSDVLNDNDTAAEQKGIEFCKKLLGQDTNWAKTSYNSNFRKHYAGIGYIFDSERDAFIPPKPYPSWELDEETCTWQPPTPYPNDGKSYIWDETTQTWQEI
jgi:hypothetical protein